MKILSSNSQSTMVQLEYFGEEYPERLLVFVECENMNRKFYKRTCKKCGGIFYNKSRTNPVDCCKRYPSETTNCHYCGKVLKILYKRFRTSKNKIFYCSRKCQSEDKRKIRDCVNCGKELTGKQRKYCSHKCSHEHRKMPFIREWIAGNEKGANTNGQLTSRIRNYLMKEAGYKCSKCGWGIPNPITGKPILTISHIDGNPSNHTIDNLEVLCYNCHTLTETFGSLNMGKGRGSVGVAR